MCSLQVCVLRAGQHLQLDLSKGSGQWRTCSPLQPTETATAFSRQPVLRAWLCNVDVNVTCKRQLSRPASLQQPEASLGLNPAAAQSTHTARHRCAQSVGLV